VPARHARVDDHDGVGLAAELEPPVERKRECLADSAAAP
jgi:hypothetical protein